MTAPAVSGLHTPMRCILDNWPGSAMKYVPSIPKPTPSTEPSPSMSDDPACEKPTLSSCFVSGTSSEIRTSKRKRPPFAPVVLRTLDNKCMKPPCDNFETTPDPEKKTSGVQSRVLNAASLLGQLAGSVSSSFS